MKYPAYPKYKDSGVEWLGEVPEVWGVLPLKRLVSMKSGEQITSEDIGEVGEYPVYGGNGLRGYTARYTHDGFYSLVGRQGALCGNINYARGKFWASEHAVVVMPIKQIPTIWLGELLRIMNLGQYSVAAAQPGLAVDIIARLLVPSPSFEEQQAIAAFLDRETAKIDALIMEQEKLVSLLQEKRQVVISHAVTKGLNPDAPMKDSGVEWLGEVPERWEVTRLKFVASIQTGIAKGKEYKDIQTISVPYLRVANVQNGFLSLDDLAELEIPPEDVERYRLRVGDVLMNEGGDFDKLGRGAIWNGEVSVCIHQNHVFAVRPHMVSSEWLNMLTSSRYAQCYFISRSKQSTNLASISSSNLMELPVILPSEGEKDSILNTINTATAKIDALIAGANKAIELLKERRSTIISAAVTGKIDVRNIPLQEAV